LFLGIHWEYSDACWYFGEADVFNHAHPFSLLHFFMQKVIVEPMGQETKLPFMTSSIPSL